MSTGGMKSATVRFSSAVYGRMAGKPKNLAICSGSFSNSRNGSQRVTFNMAHLLLREPSDSGHGELFTRFAFRAWCVRIGAFGSTDLGRPVHHQGQLRRVR